MQVFTGFLECSSKPLYTRARPPFGKMEPRSSPYNQAPRGEGPEAQEAHLCHGTMAQLISHWENKQDYEVNGLHVVTRQDRGSGSIGHGMPPKTVQAPKRFQIQNPRLPVPPPGESANLSKAPNLPHQNPSDPLQSQDPSFEHRKYFL